MLESKTILITGGAGYIGSPIALFMAQKGYRVIVLDSLLHGQTHNNNWTTLIKGDYADINLLNTIFSKNAIHAIIHCAGFIEEEKSITDPLSFYHNNVSKTITLLECMRLHSVHKIIFSSSCAVYGKPEITPIPDDHPKKPMSPYGNTKLMIENIFKDAHRAYGLQFIVLRYFNAAGALPEYGLGETHVPETHVIPLLLRAAMLKKPFYIFGTNKTSDGTCIRDFVHVWDIAHAYLLALEHLDSELPSDCFNLGTNKGISVKQIIQTVSTITGVKIKIEEQSKHTDDPPVLLADASRTHDILRWEPQYSDMDHIIRTAYQFELHTLHDNERTLQSQKKGPFLGP
ncbi:MAG: UDP-glucose 4-epimerase GalE [bacterium]|nr:UDP-glucose 4-epimerase GalE [bacterium]